jgi:RNA polymerase sigma factor (sigma-70 family)
MEANLVGRRSVAWNTGGGTLFSSYEEVKAMHTEYRSPILRQLCDQQSRYAPRDKKLDQVDRAESLLGELDPKKTYTYDYLCYRLTDFRPTSFPNHRVTGEDASHDLRLLVEDLSDSANVDTNEIRERVLTVDDLSEALMVSPKTIARWRQSGLVGRRFVVDGRKRVGFLKSSVDRFVAKNPDRVRRGSRFTQLTSDQRGEIIERARRLARTGACASDVTRRLADRMSRSVETIRYTLKQFDRENPELAIFPGSGDPLSDEARKTIYKKHHRGMSVDVLAKQYDRTRTSIYRVINEMRAQKVLDLPLDYMASPEFTRRNAASRILTPMPEPETKTRRPRVPKGLPPYLASLYDVPLLTREQEAHLFRKFNFLKYQACKIRKKLDPLKPKNGDMDEVERLYEQALVVKNQIVQANLRLVVSIAKRHVGQSDNFFELISDGNMSLIRAVEKFDYTRGFKFSTYGSWAVMKNFARTIPIEFQQLDRFRTSSDEKFVLTEEPRSDWYVAETDQAQRVSEITRILGELDEREKEIIIRRYGLNHNREPLTLKQVGEELGVTKERIRQIEARALNKLRVAAQSKKIDVPS